MPVSCPGVSYQSMKTYVRHIATVKEKVSVTIINNILSSDATAIERTPSKDVASSAERSATRFGHCTLSDPSYSTSKSTISLQKSLRVPQYDESAKKKMKVMAEDDGNIKLLGKKIIETLDNVNKKIITQQAQQEVSTNAKTTTNVVSIDYKRHLTAAVNKIPPRYENECMEYVIKQLEIFDQQPNLQDGNAKNK